MKRHIVVASVFLIFSVLVAQRIERYASSGLDRLPMPATVVVHEERLLFESPQGKYSLADIAANGSKVPSEEYLGFNATHDYEPRPGDRICPITRTKSNSACTWIVNGQNYEFCCPPCITEFVRQAKQHPDQVLQADEYIAQGR